MSKGKWAVIGGGNGGQATAGYLALAGYEISIFDVAEETVGDIQAAGGITMRGKVDGFGPIARADTDIGRIIEGAEVIVVTLPAIYHRDIAKKCAPHLKDGQVIMLHPGSTFAPISFKSVLDQENCRADYLLGGTSTLIFACRLIKNGEVNIFGMKDFVSGSALPASRNPELQRVMREAFPQIEYIKNVIEVGLDNLNAILHPGPALLNTSKIDRGEDFQYYIDGVTPGVARFAETIDQERLDIGRALKISLLDVNQTFIKEYPALKGENLFEIIQSNRSYDGLAGPKDINNRYLLEDIPYTLVPFQALARFAGVETPCIDAVITIAKALLPGKIDDGLTAPTLGLDRFASVDDLLNFVDGNI